MPRGESRDVRRPSPAIPHRDKLDARAAEAIAPGGAGVIKGPGARLIGRAEHLRREDAAPVFAAQVAAFAGRVGLAPAGPLPQTPREIQLGVHVAPVAGDDRPATQIPADRFSGEVEADETFIGGKARFMHRRKRAERIKGTGVAELTTQPTARSRAVIVAAFRL